METESTPIGAGTLTPVRSSERIQALDVVRGFALIGIFLMNVEWFNRALGEMMQGLPIGLSGADWWASRLIYTLVQGKFWTMFSLLFGMGFAVMLLRAERAGRSFLRPYLRRIAALAVFGAAHHIFIWGGDILFGYAVAALALLILLYGNWKYVAVALVALVGLGFIPKMDPLWAVAGGLAAVGVAALFLRGEKRVSIRGRSMPVFSLVFLLLGSLGAMIAGLLWALPNGPKEPRIPTAIISAAVLIIGILSARFHDPAEPRLRRLGATLYLLPVLLMTAFGIVTYVAPPTVATAQVRSQYLSQTAPGGASGEAGKRGAKTEAERKAEQDAERAERIRKQLEKNREETRVHSKGGYLESVKFRSREFAGNAANEAATAIVFVGMFMLGIWFVRSGVMENTAAHLPLFRRLAWIALPFGLGLGFLSSAICSSHTLGNLGDGFQMATGMMAIGNLPASLGYVSLIVLALNSGSILSKIRVLAPAGRMALTNYLLQSAVSALFFFGYGFGHWGMGRAWQVVFVAVVFALQVAFSRWWLGLFRYGPMEWLWRAITYWQIPSMRLEPAEAEGHLRPVEAPVP
jgi:uncharacterized protein